MASIKYLEWLAQQTEERTAASIRHMRVCRLLGIAQRRYPRSERTKKLLRDVQGYYARWEDTP